MVLNAIQAMATKQYKSQRLVVRCNGVHSLVRSGGKVWYGMAMLEPLTYDANNTFHFHLILIALRFPVDGGKRCRVLDMHFVDISSTDFAWAGVNHPPPLCMLVSGWAPLGVCRQEVDGGWGETARKGALTGGIPDF